ncbi:MAG: glycosyltransferase family 4 protein, partial [Bacteroidota bacterium]|nr:glycosyltransferase family 4 protein [Bacteroidota bacterium]
AGGVLNTMIPLKNKVEESTAIFFHEQSEEALLLAVKLMEDIYPDFDSDFIRKNALRFDEETFIHAIRNFVSEKYEKYYQSFIAS